MEQDSFVAGEFVWTGFDYLGEPTPHAGQARSSCFGIVDLAGFPKDRCYLYRSHGGRTKPPCTSSHTGIGRTGSEKTCPCSFTPTAIRPTCS